MNASTMSASSTLSRPLAAEARALACLGFAVFPVHGIAGGRCTCGDPACGAPGKHPAVTNGFKSATTDAARITTWWSEAPRSNIGLATGAGLLVVDLDGPEGAASWRALVGDAMPLTPTATTGRGTHIFFQAPDGLAATSKRGVLPGVDVRADGGYVVVAPSQHVNGATYTWHGGRALADLPLAPAPPPLLVAMSNGERAPAPFRMPSLLPEGERNDTLFRLAASLWSKGLSADAIRAALHVENATRCMPPLAGGDLNAIVRSVTTRYAPGDVTDLGAARVRWPLVTPDELLHLPPVDWLVRDYLAAGALSVLYGKPSAGKSFVALSWALAVATGRTWLGHPVRRGPVLYITPEGGSSAWGRRIAAWAAESGRPDHWDIRFIRVPVNLFERHDRALLDELHRAHAFEGRDLALVVVDTLARAAVGADENSARDMGLVVAALDHIRERTGAHTLVPHHTPKDRDDARGSGALHGAADAMFSLKKARDTLTLECTKLKDGDEAPLTRLQLVKVAESCVLRLADGTPPLSDGALRLLDMVRSSQIPVGTSLGKWGHEHGIPHSSAYRSQDELAGRGYVAKGQESWTLTPLGERALSHGPKPVPTRAWDMANLCPTDAGALEGPRVGQKLGEPDEEVIP